MNLKRTTSEPLPVDPEENLQYSKFEKLNPAWWHKLERLTENCDGELFPSVRVLGKGLELPWFNRHLRLEPETFTMTFDHGKGMQPTYQDGLVVMALLNYLDANQQLATPMELVNENHLKGGTTFFRGPHLMASILIAQRYAQSGQKFLAAGLKWGGKPVAFGEYALSFTIFPGLDWVVALWEEDEEFSARCQYLFDKSLEKMFQLDIVWALGNVVAAKLLE